MAVIYFLLGHFIARAGLKQAVLPAASPGPGFWHSPPLPEHESFPPHLHLTVSSSFTGAEMTGSYRDSILCLIRGSQASNLPKMVASAFAAHLTFSRP